jgi:hypothetical protein
VGLLAPSEFQFFTGTTCLLSFLLICTCLLNMCTCLFAYLLICTCLPQDVDYNDSGLCKGGCLFADFDSGAHALTATLVMCPADDDGADAARGTW